MTRQIVLLYAGEDEALLERLIAHLKPLQRQKLIEIWCALDISAGAEWEQEVRDHVNAAHMILLLISPAFLNSNYCYESEMKWAMQRHEQGKVHVIPIILRPCFWRVAPFERLKALPKDGKAITLWTNRDYAFMHVAEGIHKIVSN
jgi:hypothetical protein